MLPTQFIPEYYRDAKDILNADESEAPEAKKKKQRRGLMMRIRQLLHRPQPEPDAQPDSARSRPAH